LRNCAASGGTNAQTHILEADGEKVLRGLQNDFPDLREHYVKPALKDLGVLRDDEDVAYAKIGKKESIVTENEDEEEEEEDVEVEEEEEAEDE
jgi:hypothetical protein